MDLNYPTQQSFTRAFRQEFKISPLQYRLKNEFDCSVLLPSYALNLQSINIRKENVKHLRLKVESFYYQDSLLSNEYKARSNKIRLNKITEIWGAKDEAIVVSTLVPKSFLDLNVVIGYKDEKNYKIKDKRFWVVEYNGTWDNYIMFGRFFLCYCDISFDTFIMENIRYSGSNDNCEQIYQLTIYLPMTPH
ncbi:AraC family transcriptional regulator [Escherichia coli]|uniref:AraC family transcriptional regulator n=1 Tax=Escherichia coli TaxID=562 RepID=UPI000F0ACCA2|nr:AraC family transcriptional regulator [Escherichia coli]